MGKLSVCVELFDEMLEKSMVPEKQVFYCLVEIHSKNDLFSEAYEYFKLMVNDYNYPPNYYICKLLLSCCPAPFLITLSRLFFENEFIFKNLQNYQILFERAFALKDSQLAIDLFKKMKSDNISPDLDFYDFLLSSSIIIEDADLVSFLCDEILSTTNEKLRGALITKKLWAFIFIDKTPKEFLEQDKAAIFEGKYQYLLKLFDRHGKKSLFLLYKEKMEKLGFKWKPKN